MLSESNHPSFWWDLLSACTPCFLAALRPASEKPPAQYGGSVITARAQAVGSRRICSRQSPWMVR